MKIIIDTTSLTKGGGQKVGWNFVNQVIHHPIPDPEFHFFCAAGSSISKVLIENNISQVSISPCGTLKRVFWQVFIAPRILRKISPDVIYLVFGAPLYPASYCQVTGEARSNLFFPEIDFWEGLPPWTKFLKKCKDRLRISMMKRADGIIFENESMYRRGLELFHLAPEKVIHIPPSIAKADRSVSADTRSAKKSGVCSILMLCSWQKNKNYMIMPQVLRILEDRKIPSSLLFSVSSSDRSAPALAFRDLAQKLDVLKNIDFIGTVPPEQLPETYEKCDVVMLLSKLESFSNNIIEAWKFSRPLIISDMEWSHALTGDAACFVDRNDAVKIADAIIKASTDDEFRNILIRNGKEKLNHFPDISEHVDMVIDFLKCIHDRHHPSINADSARRDP